jgi:ABC-type amino acid transport substrate-binding protein
MRNLGMGDVAVRARGAAAVLDDSARLEVVDRSRLEGVREVRCAHRHVLALRALDAERADAAVGGQVVAEDELLPHLRAERVEAADGGVVRRARRDDRSAHEARA